MRTYTTRAIAFCLASTVAAAGLTACNNNRGQDGASTTTPSSTSTASATTTASSGPTPAPNPTTLGANQVAVNQYLDGIAPLQATPASDIPQGPASQTTTDSSPDPSQPSGQVRYTCTVTPYSLKANPDKIIMLNPDSAKLWPGALLQGEGYAGGLGSLRDLPISARSPLTIFTDLMGPDVSTKIDHPDGASVSQAVSTLVQKAKDAHVPVAARASFDQTEAHSSEEALLKLGISAKYLGVTATGKLDTTHTAKQSSVIASFYQRLFTVSIVKAATPANYFTDSFSVGDFKHLEDAKAIGPTNPPVVVSNISYGRVLLYSVTANTTTDKLQAAVDVAYSNGATSGKVGVDAQTQAILDTAHVSVVALGGSEDTTLHLIRDHQLGDYFAASTDLATAVPISYQVDNIANGSTAAFNETTNYNLSQCSARPNTATTMGAIVKVTNLRLVPKCNGGFYGKLALDGATAWDVAWDKREQVQSNGDLTLTPNPDFKGQPIDPSFKVQPGPGEFAVTAAHAPQFVGSIYKFVYWPDTAPLNKFQEAKNTLTWPLSYGDQAMTPAAGSTHCPMTLRYNLTKVTDLQTWAP